MGIVTAIERAMQAGAHADAAAAPVAAPVAAYGAAAARPRPWLGPAPGPDASRDAPRGASLDASQGASREGPAARPAPPQAAAPAAPRRTGRGRPAVHVAVRAMEQRGGSVHLGQTFTLAHPRDAVWSVMADAQAVARCVPGAELDAPPDAAGRIAGRIAVRLGPIAARFAGEGEVNRFPAEFRQVIAGRGGDRKSGSRVSGSVEWRLTAVAGADGGEATRVDIAIAYSLTGMLAQFGRSALARDLAVRLGEAFAQNIDARLADPAATPEPQAPLGAFALFFGVLAARLRALFARLSRRLGRPPGPR
jgi:carbon-monoxide dehydrogenase small subunit